MSAKKSGKTAKASSFSATEQAAMKERAKELKAEAKASKSKANGATALLAVLAKLPEPDRSLGTRLHSIITSTAPSLWPKLWYGMPAYANPPAPAGDGKVVCFVQPASKFKTRYCTLAFTDAAKLDKEAGAMWPTGFGLTAVTVANEASIAALVRKAVD